MAATYTESALAVAFGNGKSMASIFNGAGSGVVLRIYRIWVLNNQTAAVTGVLTTWALRRTSAQTGGTAIACTKHDSTSAAIVAQVLPATGATCTNTADIAYRQWMWSNDEPAASTATSDEMECIVPLNCVWDSTGDSNIEPIVLRESQGINVQHTGTSVVGIADIFIEFTVT